MLLDSFAAAREGVLVNLCLNFLRGIVEKDSGFGEGRGHLSVVSLQGGEELGVNEGGFDAVHPRGGVAGESEVGILIDSAGDETGDVWSAAEDNRKAGGKRRCSLNSWEGVLADIIGICEAEDGASLVVGSDALDAQDVLVERTDVGGVGENEGLVGVETNSDDILCVFAT